MSALGQKQTSPHVRAMSALPPKADIKSRVARSPVRPTSRVGRACRLCPSVKRQLVQQLPGHHLPQCRGIERCSRSSGDQAGAGRRVDYPYGDRSAVPSFDAASECRKCAGLSRCWQTIRKQVGQIALWSYLVLGRRTRGHCEVTIVGALAQILAFAQQKTTTASTRGGGTSLMVAGVGFEPTTFRL